MRPSRRRLTELGADLAARNERLAAALAEALEEASAHKAAAKTAARQFVEADEKYVDTCIVNELLTSDLTKAREKLAEFAGRRTVSEVLEEHDVHRQALADALGEEKRNLSWDALIGEAGGLAGTVADLQKRLDRATTELADVRKVEESLARQIHEMAQPVEPSDEEVDAAQLRLELDAERSRVDRLQKELDNALGMPSGGILNSAPWQPGYKAERDKQVSP